eukprot:TRINITY_DN69716_c0_g1_i1.p1 TRINITY_DN69716_c0_g1~~TRINITY_DN69716_c0_g1_i1.p1  ORF type:complete len:181 (-),score=17.64 TRINITY_DN69716_c0_g1_i1:56-535(-)
MIIVFFSFLHLLYATTGFGKREHDLDEEDRSKFSADVAAGIFSVVRLPAMLCLFLRRETILAQAEQTKEWQAEGAEQQAPTSAESDREAPQVVYTSQPSNKSQDQSLQRSPTPIVLEAQQGEQKIGKKSIGKAVELQAQVVGSQQPIEVIATLVPRNRL